MMSVLDPGKGGTGPGGQPWHDARSGSSTSRCINRGPRTKQALGGGLPWSGC